MFENIFKKDATTATPAPDAAKSPTEAHAPTHGAAPISEVEREAWQQRITTAAANVDDTSLLQIAHDAPTVPLKRAAIEALTHEASFKQAMHDFREHDKRLYRAAKSGWDTTSGTRIAGGEATALIASARSLLDQEFVPVNRVVELDHAWAALNSERIGPVLRGEFSALSEQLGEKVKAHGEHAQSITRWLGATDLAMSGLQAALPAVASGEGPPAGAETQALTLLELAQNIPAAGDARCTEKADAANRLLALASSAVQRAVFLQTLPMPGMTDETPEHSTEQGTGHNAEAREKQLIEQWRAFPEVSDSGSNAWHTTLAARFAEWRNAVTHGRENEHAALSAEDRERRREQNRQRVEAIQRDVEAAEAAHTAGHVTDLTRLLAVIDTALKRGTVNAALTQRIEVLRAEQRRLHDWQRWGGRQSREQLVTQAQALATESAGKVAIKAHTEAIDKLRERWKELDKLGAASNQTLWLNFDSALKTAYAPVAVHMEKLRVERNDNLAKREQIVTALLTAATRFFPPAAEGAATTPDWRAVSHAVEEAQTAWRKLGPVEHTVPRKAQKGDSAITTRYAAAVQALEAPLKNAYAEARSKREALITEAKALSESHVTARDIVDKVKKVQGQWQSVAKAMPLPRRDENALWIAFKTATDAVFTARDTARNAKEVETNAQQQARLDIMARLTTLAAVSNAADIKRALSDADRDWRAAPDLRDLPKPQAAKLDARYRAARDAVGTRLADLALQSEQARYDALHAAMALCGECEASASSSEAGVTGLQEKWDALEHLPAPWKARLDSRFQGKAAAPTAKSGKNTTDSVQDILLNLEVACGLNSPEEFQTARQHLKIRALKEAMEGRKTTTTTPADIERWMLDAAASARPDDVSRERLAKIIAAVRRRPAR